ncbi:hypothetical protein R6258_08760 [Halomonas sp. HP20-15]|nr:hypothetical protein [Halomonas sp. HP20-15]MDW5377005.1 hypothetical protein [Halomonas sp. HP20-15]
MIFNIACLVSKKTVAHPCFANDPLTSASEWPVPVLGANHP